MFIRAAADLLLVDRMRALAALDCYDWTDVCAANNVTIYPSVRVYRRGRDVREYTGVVTVQALVHLVTL